MCIESIQSFPLRFMKYQQLEEMQETKEISENIYIDIDEKGNLVSMTIEHAKMNAMLSEFSLKEITSKSA